MTKDEQQILLVSLRHGKDGNIKALGVAVELLVEEVERLTSARDQFRGATKDEPTSAGHFDDVLVERLAKSGSPDWDVLPEYIQDRRRCHVRAILSELALMPCELPTDDIIMRIMIGSDEFDELAPEDRLDQRAIDISAMLRRNIAPILAAKDAEIKRRLQVIRIQNTTIEVKDATIRALAAEAERDAEKTLAIRVEREQYEKTIELQKAQLANAGHGLERLQRVVAELESTLYFTQSQRNDMSAMVSTLEKRIAELTAEQAEAYQATVDAKLDLPFTDGNLPPGTIAKSVRSLVGQIKTQGENLRAASAHAVYVDACWVRTGDGRLVFDPRRSRLTKIEKWHPIAGSDLMQRVEQMPPDALLDVDDLFDDLEAQ